MKTCSKCKIEKEDNEFYKGSNSPLHSYCKKCNNKYANAWKKNNRDKVKDITRWKDHRIRKKDYEKLLIEQNYLCLICKEKPPKAIDHDHNCCPVNRSCSKCRRGLLCTRCNIMVGFVENTPETIEKIINYIKRYSPTTKIFD